MASSEKIISPGVFTNEIDQTFLPAAVEDIGAALIGPTVRGPAGIPTVVNSYSEFKAMFGDTFSSGSSSVTRNFQYFTSLTAKEYLKHNSPLTVIRVLAGDYGKASATISSSIDPSQVGGSTFATMSVSMSRLVHSETPGTSGFISCSLSYGDHAQGGGGSKTVTFFVGATASFGRSTDESLFLSGIESRSSAVVWIDSGSAALQMGASFRNEINNSSSIFPGGLSASLSPANTANDADVLKLVFGQPGAFGVYGGQHYTSSGNAGQVFGGSQSGSLPTFHTGSKTNTNATNGINPFVPNPSGSVTTKNALGATGQFFFGGGHDLNSSTSPSFKTVLKLHTLSDGAELNSRSSNWSTTGSTFYNRESGNGQLVSGSRNNFKWEITNVNKEKGTFSFTIRRGTDTDRRKQVLEKWNDVSLDPNATNYVAKVVGDQYFTLNDSGGNTPYVSVTGDYTNRSKYVRVEVIETTVNYLDENGEVATPAYSASLPAYASGSNSGSFGGSFSGGSDGTVQHPKNFYHNITDTNSQGLNLNVAAKGKTSYEDAINLIGNPDEFDINLVMMPGVVDAGTGGGSLIGKAISMCENRGDCFLIADPTFYGATIGTATGEAESRDSSYAAMYYPWVQIANAELNENVFVPPSVAMAGIYAFNDKVAHPWFAPAGLNRGIIDMAVQAERKLIHGHRDELYESNVNPIATFPGQGVCVWGQKTLQKKATSLDRVNVRRLLIKLKKFFASTARFLVFEQNDAKTRNRFLNIVNPFMEQVQSNSGVEVFRVVMDDTNNTPDIIDRNILYGQIFIQPTRSAEFIVLDFTVQPTGATFPE